jgi:hypothetical protein
MDNHFWVSKQEGRGKKLQLRDPEAEELGAEIEGRRVEKTLKTCPVCHQSCQLDAQRCTCCGNTFKEIAMRVFSKLLGSSSDIEKKLETLYVPMLQEMQGMTLTQARDTFRNLIEMAKAQSLKDGTSKFPENLGDIVLREESANPHYKAMLTKKRGLLVRDDDIRWWLNMHDLERQMMIMYDNWCGYALFLKLTKEDGLSQSEAGDKVKKSRPIFGDPDDTTVSTGDDRPLPYELMGRIHTYVLERSQSQPEQFKNELNEASSFNAFIRVKITSGEM